VNIFKEGDVVRIYDSHFGGLDGRLIGTVSEIPKEAKYKMKIFLHYKKIHTWFHYKQCRRAKTRDTGSETPYYY
jgi:transcription antitermination factor NusG